MAPKQTPLTVEEKRGIQSAEFAWDLVLQLTSLRDKRELSQARLAELIGTKQQAISRLEDPSYASHTLRTLRQVAEALRAFIDVIVIPEENLPEYLQCRYRPILDPTPAWCQEKAPEIEPWHVLETERSEIRGSQTQTLSVQRVHVRTPSGQEFDTSAAAPVA